MKRLTALLALLALWLPVAYVAAQSSTTGAVRGVVTDPDGGAMPGSTVTATSDALVSGQQSAVTSAQGIFRFPSLPVGTYSIEAHMPGFQSARQNGVVINLGQVREVNIALGSVTVLEEIVVVGEAAQVSTVANTIAFNMGESFIERQPLNRDPTSLMNYAPGIQDDMAYGAPSTYQNAYNVDGVDVSDPEIGSQWVLPSMDWVEEVQVTGLGADAEYGGFTGAVVNLVTKSGGNDFHGDVHAYYSGGGLNSENAPQGVEGAESIDSDVDVSLNLGGPVVKDALWYFVSANIRQRAIDPFFAAGAPDDDRAQSDRTETRFLGKLTWQLGESNRLLAVVDWDDVVHDYRGVGDLTLASGSEKQDSPNYVYNFSWESLINDSNFLTVKLTGYNGGDDRRPYFGDRPGHEDADSGFAWHNQLQNDTKDVSRLSFDGTWSLFADGLFTRNDSHNFKFGITVEQSSSEFVTRRNGGFSYYDDSYYCDSLNDYFADPFCGIFSSTFGGEWNLHADMDGLHFFAQDSWKVGRVTVNYGARYTKYTGNFSNPIAAPTAGGSDVYDVAMWAPRLGFVWDITGAGTTVFKAHYGIYYEGMTVTIFDREASGNALSDSAYYDYNFDTGEFDIPAGGAVEARASMDPSIKHPSVEQYVVTLEHQLAGKVLLGLDFIHRSVANINAMVVSNVDDYDPQVAPDNPIGGGGLGFYDLLAPQEYMITNPNFATREYDSVVLRARKRYADGWSLDSSLVWSDLSGTADYAYSGYGTGFDDLNGFVNADGRLPFNSEWVFKASASVDLPWQIMLSGFFQYQTGEYWTPYVRMQGLYNNDRTTVFMTDRGSEQLDDRSKLDLRLQKNFSLGSKLALGLFIDAFNVLNSEKVTAVVERWGNYYYDWEDHPGNSEWVENSNYKSPLSIQSPREIRIGAKFSW